MLLRNLLVTLSIVSITFAVKIVPSGTRCGPKFNTVCEVCCSHAGYCGDTEEFCSVPNNCQRGWGWCDSDIIPAGPKINPNHRHLLPGLPPNIDKCTVPKTLALTFDDGPSNYTMTILDILKEYDARATFFVAGVNNGHGQIDIQWQSEVQRMISEGHQVASHTWSHPNLDRLSSTGRKIEMLKNERAIANIIGKTPTFMRAPMVICGAKCMNDMKDLGYHVVAWEVDSQDWKDPQPSVSSTVARLIQDMNTRDNMFLIQHDTSQFAIEVLQRVLKFKPTDWKAVPLIECVGHAGEDAYRGVSKH